MHARMHAHSRSRYNCRDNAIPESGKECEEQLKPIYNPFISLHFKYLKLTLLLLIRLFVYLCLRELQAHKRSDGLKAVCSLWLSRRYSSARA